MEDKTQNTQDVDTVATSKPGLVTDLNPTYISKEQYSYARNAIRNSKGGDLGTIGNEPSLLDCIEAPYKIIGNISLPDDKELVFSGDGTNSEIGIGDPETCKYETVKNLACFGFDSRYPITGVARKDFNQGIIVYFTDKNLNLRRFDLDKLASVTDCTSTQVFKDISRPCIKATKGNIGNIPNGTYSVVMAYAIDGNRYSNWYSITNRLQLNSETSANAINVEISGLDEDFGEYVIGVVGNYIDPLTKGATKRAKVIGTFSTKVTKLAITDFINDDYIDIKLSELVIQNTSWKKAGIISSNSNYLLLGDLVGLPEHNYQLKALDITVEYVVKQVAADYYEESGIDVGYYRDEVYEFFIQGVDKTGGLTEKFFIKGPNKTAEDKALVSSADVYEYDKQFQDCAEPGRIEAWQVKNLAGKMIPTNVDFFCGERILGYGKMGYWQSTERFPDNKNTFGLLANEFQTYNKMPDECKVPRYSVIGGKEYVNILGVRFKNIPKFDDPDIVGYVITRSDRKGGNGTVIARGLMSNVRSYTEKDTGEKVMYSNYTVNDLRPDQYLSSTQTVWKNGKENNFNPLTDYYKDRFSFYSPHTLFEPRYTVGTEIKIETEEIATVTGSFEPVYNHPKAKLMNQFSFWLAAAVGFIESTLVLTGKNTHTQEAEFQIKTTGADAGLVTINKAGQTFPIRSVADLVGLDIVAFIKSKILAKDLSAFTIVKNVLTVIASLGIKVPYSVFAGIVQADQIFDIMYDFTGYTNYVYQYNAHAKFNKSICVADGNKRRRVTVAPKYIPSEKVSVNGEIYNNYGREKTVLLQLNKEIVNPKTVDNSRGTMTSFGVCDSKKALSTGSMYYATSKIPNPNQYGKIGSSNPVSMHSCPLSFEGDRTTSPELFGGDCIIARFSFLKKMQFFSQNLANTNYPPGTEYDYRLYRNFGYPRYWMDTTKFDFSEILSNNVINYARFSRTTTSKYNLDCKSPGRDKQVITRIDNAYMYLFNNCVIDFFVEADYNISFREKTDQGFYSKDNTNLTQIFRSDKIAFPEEFLINRVYSDIYTTEIYAPIQRADFDPANPIPVTQPNSVIYSLPSFNLQKVDNWQYFLPSNWFAFREGDFGQLTGIHKLDQDRIAFLFSKSSPYVSMGRDFLELEGTGRKITIGDGGLFAQDPREMLPTDNNYGATTSRYAFTNTHLGRYYPSPKQGRLINIDSMEDIGKYGVSYWLKQYMPISLYKYFPNYPKIENPLGGVGYLSVFDSYYETCYLTKRDFSPKKEYAQHITYDEANQVFRYKGLPIELRSQYFNDISWTISYSPLDKGFVSYHDWHPDWVIQTENHFMSVKDNKIWKHNERFDSFCNFYGQDYPFEIEFASSSGQTVEVVRSLQYLLEVYKYKNSGRDRFHVHHENFDRLVAWNTEQISPLLNLAYANPDPELNQDFPRKSFANNVSYDIAFFKEENKYSLNQFWDSVKDRGEFTNAEFHLFPTDESGYKNTVNVQAIDINKPEEERKKFRHYWNKFRFSKTVSGEHKFITKLLNIKKTISPR